MFSCGPRGCGVLCVWEPVELRAVEGLVASKHVVDGNEQFSHDGDEGLNGFLASGDQMLSEGSEVWLPAASDQGRHVEGRAQVLVTSLADVAGSFHRSARALMAGIQAGMSDPLAGIEISGEHGDLAQDQDGAGGGYTGRGDQEFELPLELLIQANDSLCLFP